MRDISLVKLLEAGCHFGHKVDRWHPKAASFIYQSREGIHIIDLVKTREGLKKGAEFMKEMAVDGKTIIFVATKRQAKGIVKEAAKKAGVPHMTIRWIGGFFTNWSEVKKNIDKLNTGKKEKAEGVWNKFPKHEIVKLDKSLRLLESVYGGVAELANVPEAVFIVDIKKEINCFREALRREITTVAIVDTNADPSDIDYSIPANDDAVGSIQFIVNYLVEGYIEGKNVREKLAGKGKEEKADTGAKQELKEKPVVQEEKIEKSEELKKEKPKEEKKKRGRPKKLSVKAGSSFAGKIEN